jgi:leucyl/phenylalanyl-tRNA--protein transferase
VSVQALERAGVRLYDVQFLTPHLASLGACQISRVDYLSRLADAREVELDLSRLDLSGIGPELSG